MALALAYKKLGSTGVWVALVDVTKGDVLKEWTPEATVNSVQHENLAVNVSQLNNAYRQPLGNLSVKSPVVLVQTFASEESAFQAKITTMLALTGSKTHLRAFVGATQCFYPNAIVSRLRAHLQGATVEFSFDFESDMITTAEP